MERMLQAKMGMTFEQVHGLAGVRPWHYFTDGRGANVHVCVGYSLTAHQPNGGTKTANFFYLFENGRLWKVVGGRDDRVPATAESHPVFSYWTVTQMIDEMTRRPALTPKQVRQRVEAQHWIGHDLERWLTILYAFGVPFWGPGYLYDECQINAIQNKYNPLRVHPGQTVDEVEKVLGPFTAQGTEQLASGRSVEWRVYVAPTYHGNPVASDLAVWFTGGRVVMVASNTFVGRGMIQPAPFK